jgi:hypothetical protein
MWIGTMQSAEVVFFMRPAEESSTLLFLAQFQTASEKHRQKHRGQVFILEEYRPISYKNQTIFSRWGKQGFNKGYSISKTKGLRLGDDITQAFNEIIPVLIV